jgi:ADP-ribose pyrophosphatase YjhB (NUDIX family)
MRPNDSDASRRYPRHMGTPPTDPPTVSSVSSADLLRWAEALSGIARTGLGFTESLYERERFDEILSIAADIAVAAGLEPEADSLLEVWRRSVGEGVPGYVTPKAAVGAVVGDDRRRLLLVRRKDSGLWLYPTGWADVGYSPSEVAQKEVLEETGIKIEIERLLGVFDPWRVRVGRVPLYLTVFLCRVTGGELRGHPLETDGVGWFSREELPAPLAMTTEWVDLAFRAIAGEPVESYYDLPRSPPWRRLPE